MRLGAPQCPKDAARLGWEAGGGVEEAGRPSGRFVDSHARIDVAVSPVPARRTIVVPPGPDPAPPPDPRSLWLSLTGQRKVNSTRFLIRVVAFP